MQLSQCLKHLTLPHEDLPQLTLVVGLKPLLEVVVLFLGGGLRMIPAVPATAQSECRCGRDGGGA